MSPRVMSRRDGSSRLPRASTLASQLAAAPACPPSAVLGQPEHVQAVATAPRTMSVVGCLQERWQPPHHTRTRRVTCHRSHQVAFQELVTTRCALDNEVVNGDLYRARRGVARPFHGACMARPLTFA